MLLFLRREELHRSIDRSIERSRDKDDNDDDDEDDDVVVKGREGRLSRMTAPSGERRRAHLLCFERSVCSISRLVPLFPLLRFEARCFPLLDRVRNISRGIFISRNYTRV